MPARDAKSIVAHRANVSFALFVAGALIGIAEMRRPIPFGQGFEMVALAQNLAAHGSFANPFLVLPTGATAANPPLYPLMLAAIIKAFRIPALILAMAATANVAANALTASLLPRISVLLYDDIAPGAVSAVLWLAAMRLDPAWDTSFTVAGLLLLCLWTATRLGRSKGISAAMVAGAIAGLLYLFNPSTLLISLPWVGYLAFRRSIRSKEAACLLITMGAILFVWMARNYHELGAFTVRTNLGMTLYASNNDCASSSMIGDESNGCYQSHHPNTSMAEAQLLRAMGEVRYDRKRTADTIAWIRTHPDRFRRLTLERVVEFWLPPLRDHRVNSGAIWLITVLSIPGLLWMTWRREAVSLYIAAVLLLYPLLYYLVVSDIRYRYPVLWLSLLPAGYFVCRLLPERALQWIRGENN